MRASDEHPLSDTDNGPTFFSTGRGGLLCSFVQSAVAKVFAVLPEPEANRCCCSASYSTVHLRFICAIPQGTQLTNHSSADWSHVTPGEYNTFPWTDASFCATFYVCFPWSLPDQMLVAGNFNCTTFVDCRVLPLTGVNQCLLLLPEDCWSVGPLHQGSAYRVI